MKRLAGLAVALLVIASLAAPAQAQDLDKLRLGDHWYGDAWDTQSLKGRVVLMEIWGFN